MSDTDGEAERAGSEREEEGAEEDEVDIEHCEVFAVGMGSTHCHIPVHCHPTHQQRRSSVDQVKN